MSSRKNSCSGSSSYTASCTCVHPISFSVGLPAVRTPYSSSTSSGTAWSSTLRTRITAPSSLLPNPRIPRCYDRFNWYYNPVRGMGYLSYKDGYKTWSYDSYYGDYTDGGAWSWAVKGPFDYRITPLSRYKDGYYRIYPIFRFRLQVYIEEIE